MKARSHETCPECGACARCSLPHSDVCRTGIMEPYIALGMQMRQERTVRDDIMTELRKR